VYVKEQLGQSSIQLTVDTYGHLITGANRAAVDRLDDVLTQPSASQTHPEPEGASAGAQPKSFVLSGELRGNRTGTLWYGRPALSLRITRQRLRAG
jgi:hypothetical protein